MLSDLAQCTLVTPSLPPMLSTPFDCSVYREMTGQALVPLRYVYVVCECVHVFGMICTT